MPPFPGGRHCGTVVPLGRANVDTDAIFPKQYGRSTARSGYDAVLFDNWRYLDAGDLGHDHSRRRPNPDFVVNQPALRGATVLLAGENFPLAPRELLLLLTQDVDWIGATLAHRERIAGFEAARLARQPWLDKVLER